MAFAFDENGAALLKGVPFTQDVHAPFRHLDSAFETGGVHSRGDIDGIAPNVIIQLGGPDHTGCYITEIETNPEKWGFQLGIMIL